MLHKLHEFAQAAIGCDGEERERATTIIGHEHQRLARRCDGRRHVARPPALGGQRAAEWRCSSTCGGWQLEGACGGCDALVVDLRHSVHGRGALAACEAYVRRVWQLRHHLAHSDSTGRSDQQTANPIAHDRAIVRHAALQLLPRISAAWQRVASTVGDKRRRGGPFLEEQVSHRRNRVLGSRRHDRCDGTRNR